MKKYDIVIVGAGPSGLTLAQCCNSIGKSVLVIDKESSIGGCHRVRRVGVRYKNNIEYLFTEHGPRVYSSTYKTFISILQDIDLSFHDFFTPYKFSVSDIGGKTIFQTLTFKEIILFALEFIKFTIVPNYGRDISVKEFIDNNNFSTLSKDTLDRICRLTDGAASDNYTIRQFLQLFNQQFFYTLYQPKIPNDVGLFNSWKQKLQSRGVDFLLNTNIDGVHQKDGTITHISSHLKLISGEQFVLAIPPENLVDLLYKSDVVISNSFGDFDKLSKWNDATEYIEYISCTFHWDIQLNLEKVWGFPRTEWGVAFIVLTDYMTFTENTSRTVISTAITITNTKSTRIGKTPDECKEIELLDEIFHQLKSSFPNLPKPTYTLMSPGVYFDKYKSKWISKDTAFISTTKQPFLNSTSKTIKNLFTLGTHNGNHLYSFTSLEAAVSNGVHLSHVLYPELKKKYNIKKCLYVTDVITISIIILIIIYIYVFNRKRKRN